MKENDQKKRKKRNMASKEKASKSKCLDSKSTTKNNPSYHDVEMDRVDSRHESRSNPAEWYIPNDTILRNVANIPFGAAVGARRDFNLSGAELERTSVPGIATITMAPTMGASNHFNSPINIATRNVYSFLRQDQTGSRNYDAVDLGIYLGAMDSALSYLSWMRRIYGLMTLNNVSNRYVPYGLVRSLSVNYQDMLIHMADLRAYINQYAFRLSAMCIPAHFTFIARHMWLYDGIYMDDEVGKAQLYAFKPYGFWHFDLSDGSTAEMGPTGAGYLRMQKMQYIDNVDYEITFDDMVTRGEQIVNPILSGVGMEDFNIISADILKSYGANGVFRATMIPDDYSVIPVHDDVVLNQIQNAELIGKSTNIPEKAWNVYQDTNVSYLIDQPEWEVSSLGYKYWKAAHLLNAYDTVPSPEYVIDATRLKVNVAITESTTPGSQKTSFSVDDCGSDIALEMYLWEFAYNAQNKWVLKQSDVYTYINNLRLIVGDSTVQHVSTANGWLNQLAKISSFRKHPIMLTNASTKDPSTGDTAALNEAQHFIGDVANYAIISHEEISNMHQAATLKQFGVEMRGSADV